MKTNTDDVTSFGFDYIERVMCGNCEQVRPCAVSAGPETIITLCSGCLVDLANVVFEADVPF